MYQLRRKQPRTVATFALSEGPGSYTGLRIGASTAKGLCYGLNVPLIPVPTLEILCEAAKSKIENRESKIVLIPMIDARRMEVYTMIDGETKAVVVENEESLINDQLPMTNDQSVYYFGDGAEKCSKVFTKPNWHLVPNILPEARFVGVLAENQKSKIENQKSIDLAYYEPFYLKEFIAAQSHVKGLK